MGKLQDFEKAAEAGRLNARKHRLPVILGSFVIVAVVNLVHAYQHKSVFDAIAVIVIWLILGPVFAFWLVQQNPND